jgi:pimeloyl-ACP methyl ester carboxylesterase
VVIPGIMGSKLRDKQTGELVWLDPGSVPKNPLQWNGWLDRVLRTLAYPNNNLEVAGIMDQLVFVPPWAKQEHYTRLLTALQRMGYRSAGTDAPGQGPVVYSFAYDWRQDNRVSARQLGEAIDAWRTRHPGAEAWIIAHSMGGMVARWYIEREGGSSRVGRLLLMGSPWDGAPKAMHMLFDGFTFLRRWPSILNMSERSRAVVRTFPSAYQLLPHSRPFLRDVHGQPVDVFAERGWLDQRQHELLEDGQRFNQDLGVAASVETLCFLGARTTP